MSNNLAPLRNCRQPRRVEILKNVLSIELCRFAGERHQPCDTSSCSVRLERRLKAYFEFYIENTHAYTVSGGPDASSPLQSHEDLWELIKLLKQTSSTPRKHVFALFSQHMGRNPAKTATVDENNALDLAVRLLIMLNSTSNYSSIDVAEYGLIQPGWADEDSLAQFVQSCFPQLNVQVLGVVRLNQTEHFIQGELTAHKLQKKARLKFETTDDPRAHLKLDRKSGTVKIYHHVAFLKEQLKLSKTLPENATILMQLERGALPRQLALEIIDSIQKIIFRLWDGKSLRILDKLIETNNFDPECRQRDVGEIRGSHEGEVAYSCLGGRLAELFEEMTDPTPRGHFWRWLHRKSNSRYMMLATLIGVLFAVILGVLSLIASALQVYVSYQAWKYPINR